MSPRYLCLQGHLWVYEDRAVRPALFCPTCGLRLYSENQTPTSPVPAPQLLRGAPTPMSNADVWRLNRNSADSSATSYALQPNEIEAVPGYELLGILAEAAWESSFGPANSRSNAKLP